MTPDADLDVARLTPSPPVTAPEAAEAIRACFGLSGELARLPGEADDNFLLDAGGDQRYVVKFAHLRADPGGGRRPGPGAAAHRVDRARLPVPRVLPATDGSAVDQVPDGPLRGRVVHVLSYLDGHAAPVGGHGPAAAPRPRRHPGRARAGRCAASTTRWCTGRCCGTSPSCPGCAPWSPNGSARHSLVEEQFGRLAADVPPRLAGQRSQLVHNDFSPDNTLISADGSRVCGIIDFGDVTVTALVNDVAIAVANLLADDADPFGPALDFVAGYHAVTPLTTAELNLLPDLILGRVVARIIISEWRAERFPENRAYVLRNTPRAWEHLHRLLSIASEQTAARIQEATRA